MDLTDILILMVFMVSYGTSLFAAYTYGKLKGIEKSEKIIKELHEEKK